MALYDDAAGRPGRRLAISNLFGVIDGRNGSGPNVNVSLVPATRYWVAAACGDADQVPLLKKVDGAQVYFEYRNQVSFTWGQSFPQEFPSVAQQVSGVSLGVNAQIIDMP